VLGGCTLLIGDLIITSSFLARAGAESCTKKIALRSNMNTTMIFDEMAMKFTRKTMVVASLEWD
jgi:hypothetical protein